MTSSYWFQGEGAPGPDVGDPIGESLRFRKDTTPSLSRTMGTGDRKKFTVSAWVKRAGLPGADQTHIWNYHANPNVCALGFQNNKLRFYHYSSDGTFNAEYRSTAEFRDPSAWYHIVVAVDTTVVSPSTDRIKLWVNGGRITALDETNTFPQDYDTFVGIDGYENLIGKYSDGTSFSLDGHLAETYFIDGQALLADAFGRYNREGVWVPVKPDFSKTTGGEKYSSYLTASNGNFITSPTLAFNGDVDPTASGTGRCYTDVGADITWAPETPVPFTTSLEIFNTNQPAQQEIIWDGNTVQPTGGWVTVYSGSGEVSQDKPLYINSVGAQRAELHAVRIDGELVNDPYIWSSQLFTSPGYGNIDYNSTAKSFQSTSPVENGFDNQSNTFVQCDENNSWFFKPQGLTATKIEIQLTNAYGDPTGGAFEFNGVEQTGFPGQSWYTVYEGEAITDWTLGGWYRPDGGNGFSMIRVNGVVLIDGLNPTYGTNGYHLDFSDPNNIGADRSGNGNNFTATGFDTNYPGLWSDAVTTNKSWNDTLAPYTAGETDYIWLGNCSSGDCDDATYVFEPASPINLNGNTLRLGTGGTSYNQTKFKFTFDDSSEVELDWQANASATTFQDVKTGNVGLVKMEMIYDGPYSSASNHGGLTGLWLGTNKLVDSTWGNTDWLLDSPTQNYSTYQSNLPAGTLTLNKANLGTLGDGAWRETASQFRLTSGQWIWETIRDENGGYVGIISETNDDNPDYAGTSGFPAWSVIFDISSYPGYARYYVVNSPTAGSGVTNNYGSVGVVQGDVITTLLDVDNTRIRWDINGAVGEWVDYSQWLDDYPVIPVQTGTNTSQVSVNYGQAPFLYPVEGYNALTTLNLPSQPISDGGEHFRVLTGPGASILGVAQAQLNGDNGTGFQRALWWIKQRTTGNNQLLDSVRGGDAIFYSDGANAESTYTAPTTDSVAWCWKAGESVETNNDGSLQTQVCANTEAGFSIVSYTGNLTAGATIGHGLDKAPEFIMVKARNFSQDWHCSVPNAIGSNSLLLNTPNGAADYNSWNSTAPDNSVITLGPVDGTNRSGEEYFAYCWHSVPGYCKVGQYVGNGDVDGPVINCGFKPAFVMIKRTDSAGDWIISDGARATYNPINLSLRPNEANAEETNYPIDFTSTGFKYRWAGGDNNTSNSPIIFIAFARHPFGGNKISPATAGFVGPVEYEGIVPGMASSLRFRGGSYLNRSIQWGSNTTYSVWLKRAFVDKEEYFVGSAASAVYHQAAFLANNTLQGDNTSTSSNSVGLFRDTTSWYHIVYARGDSNTRLYVNGREVEYNAEATSSGAQSGPIDFTIGGLGGTGSNGMAGYMSNIHFVDGQQLGPEAFGEYDENGIWVAKEYTGSYGDWGFHLIMDPAYQSGTTLLDQSGNDRHFSMYGFTLSDATNPNYDWMRDGPASNYSLLSPLAPVNGDGYPGTTTAFLDANCKANSSGISNGGPWNTSLCIQPDDPTTYYAEFSEITAGGSHPHFGVIEAQQWLQGVGKSAPYNPSYYNYFQDGTIGHQSDNVNAVRVVLTTGESYTTGDVIGVAYNAYDKRLEFYKNGVLQGQVERDPLGFDTMFVGNLTGAGDSYSGNWGQRPYTYPTANNYNYNDNGITGANFPVTIEKPSDHFQVVTYQGGGTGQSLDFGFVPDLVWFKTRTAANDHLWVDSVRGGSEGLACNTDAANTSSAQYITNFNNGGLVETGNASQIDDTGQDQVAWAWKAGGAAVTNNDGDITSQVSANTTAGFSIVSYTGNNTVSQTVGHGLDKAPNFIILKNRNRPSTQWVVYTDALPPSATIDSGEPLYDMLGLNVTAASYLDQEDAIWDSTDTTFRVRPSASTEGNWCNNNGDPFIAYCWHEVSGYSKVGRFVGSGSDNGPYVHCGFRPRFILYKNASNGSSAWDLIDLARTPANPQNRTLAAEASTAEESGYIRFDILSQGFKARSNFNANNQSGSSIIFIAFAEMPPQSSLAV